MVYDAIIERLLDYFTNAPYDQEVAMAKNEFFGQLGTGIEGASIEDSPVFEMKMNQFLDWYLFTRPLSQKKIPPISWAMESIDYRITEGERELYANLSISRHSLFEFLKVARECVYVRDLFNGKKVILKNSMVTHGFNTDEIFETRIFPYEDTFVFSRGFCFHPAEARKFILKETKLVKKAGVSAQEQLMFKLLKMRYKYDQYRHVALEHIYTNDSKMKF